MSRDKTAMAMHGTHGSAIFPKGIAAAGFAFRMPAVASYQLTAPVRLHATGLRQWSRRDR